MVKGIDTTYVGQAVANTQVNKNDVQKLVKYVGGETLEQLPDTFTSATKDAVSGSLLFDGLPIFKLFRNNKKVNGLGSEHLAKLDQRTFENVKNLFNGEGKFGQRIADFVSNNTKIKSEFDAVGSYVKTTRKAEKAAAKATKAAAKAAEKGGFFSEVTAKKAAKKAAKAATKASTAKDAFLSATSQNAAKEGAKATGKIAGKIGSKLGSFGKILKSSGAGIMLVFSGIIEGATEVIPTFKELGAKKGMKQAGKSAVKVAGDTAGFVIGNQVGTALGAAAGSALAGTKLGAAIGSVVPGYGTAIGAVVGCICGFLGSWVAGKITKKITGKSEREKAKEKQQKEQATEISKNQKALDELKAITVQKIEEEKATGKVSKDSLIAQEALANIEKNNPFQTFA